MNLNAMSAAEGSSLVVVILTFNSADVIQRTIEAAQRISQNIVCVDSGSVDGTLDVLHRCGVVVVNRPFVNYADQRNWSIDFIGKSFDWQLHLDADEVLDHDAISQIVKVSNAPKEHNAFLIRRRTYFMGCPLRYGGTVSWHLRLFKTGCARCEDRLYDQHFVSTDSPGRIAVGWMHDLNASSLTEWTARHNRWSDLESRQVGKSNEEAKANLLAARLSSDPRERTRFLKGGYYRLPIVWRGVAYFLYRYVLRGGFLDGRVGLIYCILQALWFRVLVDAKIVEGKSAVSGS